MYNNGFTSIFLFNYSQGWSILSISLMTVNHWVTGSSPVRGANIQKGCSNTTLFHF